MNDHEAGLSLPDAHAEFLHQLRKLIGKETNSQFGKRIEYSRQRVGQVLDGDLPSDRFLRNCELAFGFEACNQLRDALEAARDEIKSEVRFKREPQPLEPAPGGYREPDILEGLARALRLTLHRFGIGIAPEQGAPPEEATTGVDARASVAASAGALAPRRLDAWPSPQDVLPPNTSLKRCGRCANWVDSDDGRCWSCAAFMPDD